MVIPTSGTEKCVLSDNNIFQKYLPEDRPDHLLSPNPMKFRIFVSGVACYYIKSSSQASAPPTKTISQKKFYFLFFLVHMRMTFFWDHILFENPLKYGLQDLPFCIIVEWETCHFKQVSVHNMFMILSM